MKPSLLATKTYLPPVPEYHIPRSRLEQRLDAAVRGHQRLILISAPPGSGKSSLVAAWAARQIVPLAWVSLEAGDNDPALFWSYFLAALQEPLGEPAKAMLADLTASPAVSPALLPGLVNLLCTRPAPLVVALDDYHAIENSEIHQGVEYLLEHLPAQTCLAITTRIDPPLPLHRWRARGQLTEIRAADLRFTLEEAGEFLTHTMGLDLRAADVRKLEERTEGWATGLQLAALSMQGRSDLGAFIEQFSGSQHFVLEYLMNEVLARQSAEVQRFLLRTSILESLCGELCDKLIENSQDPSFRFSALGSRFSISQDILTYLASSNLFLVPLNEERTWFRYQHLFGDFLRQRLKRQGEDLHGLHQRAADWYAANHDVDEAIRHALAADNAPFAVDLIRKHWQAAASEGRTQAVVRWLEALPATLLAEDSLLSLVYAWMLFSMGKTNSVDTHIQNASRGLGETTEPWAAGQLLALRAMQAARAGDLPATQRLVAEALRRSAPEDAPVRGLAWLAQANLQRETGDFLGAIAAYQQALPLLPLTGILSGSLAMIVTLGSAYLVQGQVQAAEELYHHSLAQAVASGQAGAPAVGLLQIELAGIEYERNHLDDARALFVRGEANSHLSGLADLYQRTALLGAKLSRQENDLPGAIQRLKEAFEWVRPADAPNLSAELSAWLARMQAEAGDLASAAAWASRVRPCPNHNPGHTHGVELFARLRVLVGQGKLEEALSLAERLEMLAAGGQSLRRVVESRMLQAEILWSQGRRAESVERLLDSLALAEPVGLARLFLDEGDRLGAVLAAAQSSPRWSGFAAGLLACFRQESSAPLAGEAPSLGPADIGLTERELDVLRGLIAGLSYPEIAARLIISPGTVKTHASHIYAKLGVQGRLEAIRRAQELKIA